MSEKSALPIFSLREQYLLAFCSGSYSGSKAVIDHWQGVSVVKFLLFMFNGLSVAFALTLTLFLMIRGVELNLKERLIFFSIYLVLVLNHNELSGVFLHFIQRSSIDSL